MARRRHTEIVVALLVCCISSVGYSEFCWRLMASSRLCRADNDYVGCAPNNAWSICRDNDDNLHAVFTRHYGTRLKVYRCRSTDSGKTWDGPDRMSTWNAEWARDAAIATIGHYVGIAWTESLPDPGERAHIKYRQSVDYGVTWPSEPPLKVSGRNNPDSHWGSQHPSLVMCINDDRPLPDNKYACIVFEDSSKYHLSGAIRDTGNHIATRRVKTWQVAGPDPDAALDPEDTPWPRSEETASNPRYPSTCRDYNSSHLGKVQNEWAHGTWEDYLVGMSGQQILYNYCGGTTIDNELVTGSPSLDHRASSIQFALNPVSTDDDTLVVAYEYDNPLYNKRTIQLARAPEQSASPTWVLSDPFEPWQSSLFDMYRPNLWFENGTLFMTFIHDLDGAGEMHICMSHSTDYGASWSRPKYVAWSQTDSASIVGKGRDAFVVGVRTFTSGSFEKHEARFYRLYYQDLEVPEEVTHDGMGGGCRRVYQTVRSSRDMAYRASVMEWTSPALVDTKLGGTLLPDCFILGRA